jgi:Flp pilus assembly protein CpaB
VTDLEYSSETALLGQLPVGRSLLSRIKLGHVVMVLAALFALVFNLAVLRSNDATIDVAVASTDIRAGTTLTMSHFDVATVPADDLLSARFVHAADIDTTVGQLTTRSITFGSPVLLSDLLLVENRDGLRAMSVPIDQSRAVSGHLARGDSVDIVLVDDGVATYIATGVEVLDVPSADTNALGARTGYAPTLAVDAGQALRIASALDIGEVHIVRSTGSALPELEQATAVEATSESQSG